MGKVLGIIPARGGSKGISKKNLYPIAGKPLIQYTIETAKDCKSLDRWIVSTDCEEIATVANECGASVPFIRPKELATDTALAKDVIKHAVIEAEKLDNDEYEYVIMLQPTSPIRTAQDVDKIVEKLVRTGCDSIISVVDVGASHPSRMYTINNDKLLSVLHEPVVMGPRQTLPAVFIRSGAVYACRKDILFRYDSMIGPDVRPFILSPHRHVNIDTKVDAMLAEIYLSE